ncbi:hypothetical protein LI328DRAFT_123666 [Trichoderma asperelloides]|nr:hypothetical protein LI328DRAFT_123666 [Trichoderma asperelloides]
MPRRRLANSGPQERKKTNKQTKKTKTHFSTPRLHNLAREQKVPKSLASFQSLVFRPLRGQVVQSVGIRPSHAAAKHCCNRVVQIFFLAFSLLLLIRFSFSFEPTPKFFFSQPLNLA